MTLHFLKLYVLTSSIVILTEPISIAFSEYLMTTLNAILINFIYLSNFQTPLWCPLWCSQGTPSRIVHLIYYELHEELSGGLSLRKVWELNGKFQLLKTSKQALSCRLQCDCTPAAWWPARSTVVLTSLRMLATWKQRGECQVGLPHLGTNFQVMQG